MQDFVPVDFHCHGIGRFDFAEPGSLLLDELERHLRIEGTASLLTLYLPKSHLADFIQFVADYDEGRRAGRYRHVLGIALEGPLLASFGGTPERGCWAPKREEWRRLAELGPKGLVYVVISPNASIPSGDEYPESVVEIFDILLDHGVRPALGHFGKQDPEFSAEMTKIVCEHVIRRGDGPLFTDHLFNDMPVNSRYNWRTAAEKAERAATLPDILKVEWTDESIREVLGPVPATLMSYARRGVLKIALNCDGDHVDLEVCKRAIDYVGAGNMMLMTDRIQSEVLAGQRLQKMAGNTLLYQSRGIVAGGTQSVMRQIGNLLRLGVASNDIFRFVHGTPMDALDAARPALRDAAPGELHPV